MGLATVVQTEWGYYVTGDTDTTVLESKGKRYRVKTVAFVNSATDDTCLLTTSKNITGASTNFINFGVMDSASQTQKITFGDDGVPADNLAVKFSAGAGQCYIYLA